MQYKVTGKQYNSKLCFICGLKNSSGLQASFYETEDRQLIATFQPTEEHQSYPGRLHGGIASAILDETIGRAVMIGNDKEIWGLTVELKLEYKKPIPLDQEVRVVARITEENSRFFQGTGEIVLANGDIAVVAHGRYMKASLAKIADFDPVENEWQVVKRDEDPVFFDI
jgi:uncharacterized protein (TIGR00369 family)